MKKKKKKKRRKENTLFSANEEGHILNIDVQDGSLGFGQCQHKAQLQQFLATGTLTQHWLALLHLGPDHLHHLL